METYQDKMMVDFIDKLPKAELHVHIEGTLEPEMMINLAEKNGIVLKYDSVEQIRESYEFNDLQSFLDVYYEGCKVLVEEEDFYEITWAYFKKCYAQNVVYAELFFDPQSHTSRGVRFGDVIGGINRACEEAREVLGIDSKVIMCFLRHLSQEEAFDTLIDSLPHRSMIFGVGLDSKEIGNPPQNFVSVFAKARVEGYEVVAHAGEEGPASNIWNSLLLLGATRIDHGVACTKDDLLVEFLADNQIPLTVCPISNVKLKVFNKMEDHNLKEMLDKGLLITINSDDPAYFGGYLNQNYFECQKHLDIDLDDIITLVKNSFKASFMDDEWKNHFIGLVEESLEPREVYRYSTPSRSFD